ncbi:hypothetical protein JW756_02200 [Candidatus Woesearchaeota archaeon]|nr:hypothetical protein [Candidatus Woesearchaeota archaeon]
MKKKGGAETSSYLVAIGAVIGVLVLFTIGYAVAPLLKPKDVSLERFNKLADQIEAMSQSGAQGESEAVLMHLSQNELILFFDNNTNSSVLLAYCGEIDPTSNFDIQNRDSRFKQIIDESSWEAIYQPIFIKPTSCGNKACMILCRSFELYKPSNIAQFINDKVNYLDAVRDIDFTAALCTGVAATRTFSNITHFYQKRYNLFAERAKPLFTKSGLTPCEKYQGATWTNPSISRPALTKDWYSSQFGIYPFHGASIFSNTLFFRADIYEDLAQGKQVKGELINFNDFQLIDLFDDSGSGWIKLTPDFYITVAPLDSDMTICHQPPCYSSQDQLYSRWKTTLSNCLDNNICDAFYTMIDTVTMTGNELTLKIEDDELKIILTYNTVVFGDKTLTFSFDRDVQMFVKVANAEGDGESVASITFKKEDMVIQTKKENLLTLEANGAKHTLVQLLISSIPADVEKNTKAKLIFKMKEAELPASS